jgi:hypothetical protein
MARDFTPSHIGISTGLGRCAYRCRYCLLAYYRPATYKIDRYIAVVEKFMEYKARTGFHFNQWLGYSFDIDTEDFAKQLDLVRRCGGEMPCFLMGGLRLMAEGDLRQWLEARRALGCTSMVASYVGHGALNDYWHNQPGHFDFQIKAQKLALAMGFTTGQRLFLLRSSLPLLGELMDILDEVSGEDTTREAYPLLYNGLARQYEHERVTWEMLEKQSTRVASVFHKNKINWRSEQEWIAWVLAGNEWVQPCYLVLHITDANIERIEKMSCEQIIEDLTAQTRAAYAMMPTTEELAEKYGDPANDKIYSFVWDMECLWLDRFCKQNPNVTIARNLTYLGR